MVTKAETKQAEKKNGILDLAVVIVEAIIIAGVIRIFLFQPFNIPSGSMEQTLLIGDYLFVSKFSYGFSKYSFPWGLGFFNGRILSSEPERGDVIVFKYPRDNYTDYIKRLIGLPGDRIQMRDGVLYINDKPVERKRLPDVVADTGTMCGVQPIHQYQEVLPNGKTYVTQKISETCKLAVESSRGDNTEVFVVPPGHYFMMGDNRDNSLDSRFQEGSGVGFVPRENLIGRARVVFFSIDKDASWFAPWRWLWQIRWTRIGDIIH